MVRENLTEIHTGPLSQWDVWICWPYFCICTGRIVATVERVVIVDSEHLFYKRASIL